MAFIVKRGAKGRVLTQALQIGPVGMKRTRKVHPYWFLHQTEGDSFGRCSRHNVGMAQTLLKP